MPPTTLTLATGGLELLDIPGDPGEPALVLMHEGLGSLGLWRGFPERLAAATGRRTVAFSRFGHGQSDPPRKTRTPAFMHEEALEVLPELLAGLELAQPVLVGHSDGASIALIYAAHHEVPGVVAIAPHVFVEDVCLTEIRRAREAYTDGDLKERMARHHRDPDAAFFGWNDVWLDPAFPDWSITDELERISCPLLLIQGERDQYGTLAQLDAIERLAAGPVRRVHLDCQHSPPTEMPDETVDAIAEFVDGPSPAHPPPVHRVTIRIAGRRDTDAIAPLLGQLGYPASAVEVGERLERLANNPDAEVLVAELGDEVVGVAAYQLIDLLERPEPQCRITALVVDDRHRRRGVAYALLHMIEESARDVGCFRLEVTTRPDRAEASALYRAAGFDERPRRLIKLLVDEPHR